MAGTGNPVPSDQIADLKANAETLDQFVSSDAESATTRTNKTIKTIKGIEQEANDAIAKAGYVIIGDFASGFTINNRNEIALYDDGVAPTYFRWDGTLPKTVSAASTPSGAGGINVGAWLNVGQAALRQDLASPASGKGIDLVAKPNPIELDDGNTVASFGDVFNEDGKIENAIVHRVCGVIRHYQTTNRWDLLYNQGQGHASIGVSSVSSDGGQEITVSFDTSKFRTNSRVCSFVVTPDESLAASGISCGASVGTGFANIQISAPQPSDFIHYNGTDWVSARNEFNSLTWASGKLQVGPRVEGIFSNTPFLCINSRSNANVVAQIDAHGTDYVEVVFRDWSGNQITTPNTDMQFYIYSPNSFRQTVVNNDAFSVGNLWFEGSIISWD